MKKKSRNPGWRLSTARNHGNARATKTRGAGESTSVRSVVQSRPVETAQMKKMDPGSTIAMRPFVRNAPAHIAPKSADMPIHGRSASRRSTAARPESSVAAKKNVRSPSVRFVREKRNPIGAARNRTAAERPPRDAPMLRAARKTSNAVPVPARRVGSRAAHGVSPNTRSDAAFSQ